MTIAGLVDRNDQIVGSAVHAIFTGIEVLAHVKPRLPGLRGIVLTNYNSPQHLKASADAGAEYFLDKSVDFERITEILRMMLDTQEH